MLKRFLIFFLISVTALNGMYTPSPVDAQDATPVPGESQVEDQSTPDTVPTPTSAPTETLPVTEQPETDSNQNVQAQDDDDVGPVVPISLTANGESTSLVVPINSSVLLNATGPWEASEGSLHFNVYPDSTCSGNVDIDNAPDYSASGSATYTWKVTFDGTFFVRLAWVTDEDVLFSNCVQIDVTVPIALTANGQASSLEVPVNADIVLTATGPWEASQQVNSNIYFNLYADSTCAVLNDVRVYNLPADGPATDTWRVASVGTYSFNFTWRLQRQDGDDRYSSNCVQVNVINAPLLLTANGSQAQVNVTYPVSIPLQASSASWAGAGEWSNADIDADIYVFSGTSCSSNDPTYIPLNGVNSIATATFQPPATGDYSLQVWWFPGPTLSNCLDIHVTAPVITLTSNGSKDPVNVTYPDSVPLQASSASWAGAGEWSNADIDADIYVFPGSSCTSNDPTYIPLNGVDSIATSTFLPPTTGDYSLQVWWFPGPSLSNCLDVHVVSPVITLTSNGSKDPVNASYPVTVPLNVTGPWDEYDDQEQELLDLNLSVYRGTSCSGEIAQTVPVQVIDGIAATSFQPSPGDFALQATWPPHTTNCLLVHVDPPVLSLESNGSVDPLNVTYPVTVPLRVFGPWEYLDDQTQALLDLDLNVYRGTSCSGEAVQTVSVQVIDGIAATSLQPSPGDFALEATWPPFATNCLLVHVDPPVLSLQSNGSEGPLNVTYPVTVPLNVLGPWEYYDDATQSQLDVDIYVYAGATCSGASIATIPVPVENGIATSTYQMPGSGDYSLQAIWQPYSSNCLVIHSFPTDIHLTANGEIGPITVPAGSTVNFLATGGWSATDSVHTERWLTTDETCSGTSITASTGVPTAAGQNEFSGTFLDEGTFGVRLDWDGIESNCAIIHVVPPVIQLKANGELGPITVPAGSTVNFLATGPWSATDSVHTERWLTTDETCSGMSITASTGVPTAAGQNEFSGMFLDEGTFGVQLSWNDYPSNCVIIQVIPPVIQLKANGELGPITVPQGSTVNFVATGPWSATDSVHTERWLTTDETCSGMSITATTGVPTAAGQNEFSGTFLDEGTYGVLLNWHDYPSNCVVIHVIVDPSYTPSPTVTVTATVNPPETITPSPSVTATGTASPTGTTEPTSSASATATNAPTATEQAVTGLPSTGDGPGSGSMWLGSATLLAMAMTLLGAFVYRSNRQRS